MSKIIPKLNLNKTPQLVENGSMVFAKNIKLQADNTLSTDNSFEKITSNYNIIGQIVGLDNIVYLFTDTQILAYSEDAVDDKGNPILKPIACGWKYHGGKIDGIVTTNNTGEKIITICEYDCSENVPIKHINLSQCSGSDDETIYTQTPNVPISNIHLAGKYSATIPNGVYQFYIRYKIRKDFYTPWFPCSGEFHAGENQRDFTVQGSIRYIDTNYDCPKSFILDVEHLYPIINSYKEYQLGFIISNDNGTYGRSWKTFNINTNKIYFTYDSDDVAEVDINELIRINYELTNVGNITYYKNKLYVSNYDETDFNKTIDVSSIKVELKSKELDTTNVSNLDNEILEEDESRKNYTKWGNKNISSLLATKHTPIVIANQTIATKPIKLTIATFNAKASNTQVAGRTIDVYSINRWEKKCTINEKLILEDFDKISYGDLLTSLQDSNNKYITVTDDRTKINSVHPIRNILNLDHYWLWCSTKNDGNAFGSYNFKIYHTGINDVSFPNKTWKESILQEVKRKYPATILTKVSVIDGNDNKILLFDNTDISEESTNINGKIISYNQFATQSQIESAVFNILQNKITKIDKSGNYIINDNNGDHVIQYINILYYNLTYDINITNVTGTTVENKFDINTNATKVENKLSISLNTNNIKQNITNIEERTLMPFTTYEFYFHTVKQNGVVSNGHFIGEATYNGYTEENKVQVIYPEITGVPKKIEDCSAWFVSAYPSKNKVARGFNHYTDGEYHYIDCLECDTLLYNLSKNINIYINNDNTFTQVTSDAEYFSSGNSTVPKLFGNAGVIRWRINENEPVDNDYEILTQRIKIPVTNGEANGTICVQVDGANMYEDDDENIVSTPISKLSYIDLSKKPSTVSLKQYITTQLSAIREGLTDNLTISTTANFKDKYADVSSLFSDILDEKSTEQYYTFNSDGSALTPLTNDKIINLNEDEYNTDVNNFNKLLQFKSFKFNKLAQIKSFKFNKFVQVKSLDLTATQTVINNANLAIGINSISEENYKPKASIKGAKNINKFNSDGGFADIDVTCSPNKEKASIEDGLDKDNNTCVTGQSMYNTTLNDMTVASADPTQLADAIDATQTKLKSIIDSVHTEDDEDFNTIEDDEDLNTINARIISYENNLAAGTAGKVINITKNGKTITLYDKNTIFKADDATDYYEVVITSKDNKFGVNTISALTLHYVSDNNSINGGNKIIKNNKSIRKNKSSKLDSIMLGKINRAKTKRNSYWVVINDDDTTNENKQLTKITPYITKGVVKYDDYKKMNLPGFICTVEKLDHAINDILYINGTSVYNKEIAEDGCIELDELQGKIVNRVSNVFYVPSNFNLNCLKLREDLITAIRTYTISDIKLDSEDNTSEITEEQGRQTFKAFNSLVASSIYELPKMYKDYLKQTYYTVQNDTITRFDNTIRSSNVNVDEVYRNIYTFNSEDYYHVPANRGKIVYLFTILDTIFVHNEHALYKFSGKNSLNSETGDVNLKPTDAFDNGISVLLDSVNGFGGLKEKHHGIIMSNSYIFYDDYAKTLYAYIEQSGTVDISESIQKLLNYHNPSDVRFIADEAGGRFYVSFKIKDDNICLSFSFRNKGFISVHDFDFDDSFNTRTNSYIKSYDDNIKTHTLYKIDNSYNSTKADYKECYKQSAISISDCETEGQSSIDIIYNEHYENIKVLNHINWIVSAIKKFETNLINMAEEDIDSTYKGFKVRIYSDQCYTDLINCTSDSSNDYSIDDIKSYTGIRYNQGIWSMNYFRDIKNSGGTTQTTYTQDNSLMYGKYFVFRIVFNDNFKFENVTFNITDYEKV